MLSDKIALLVKLWLLVLMGLNKEGFRNVGKVDYVGLVLKLANRKISKDLDLCIKEELMAKLTKSKYSIPLMESNLTVIMTVRPSLSPMTDSTSLRLC